MPFLANPDKQRVKDSQPLQGRSQAPETSQSHVLSKSTLPHRTVIFTLNKLVGTEDLSPWAVSPALSPSPRAVSPALPPQGWHTAALSPDPREGCSAPGQALPQLQLPREARGSAGEPGTLRRGAGSSSPVSSAWGRQEG